MTVPPLGRVQATFAATLVDEWVRAGVTDAVVAPGSRSTPLVLALAAASGRGNLRLHVHLDERSAAFFALGIGLGSTRPAVVVTTSGTAAVELGPAVVEAHHARVPLIVCTADRPPELHDVGAPQTIAQSDLYGSGVLRWRADPGPVYALAPGSWRSLASRAVASACSDRAGPGPVHLNLAFGDPLVAEPGRLPAGRRGGRPWHEVVAAPATASAVAPAAAAAGSVAALVSILDGRCGVIVAGAGCGDPDGVLALGRSLAWPVLADPRSGCRGPGATAGGVIAAFDSLLRHAGFAGGHRPEVVLRLGVPPASKALAMWVSSSGAESVVVDPWGVWPDPERTASLLIAAHPSAVCRALTGGDGPGGLVRPAPDGWLAGWARAEAAAQRAMAIVLDAGADAGADGPPTEPGVARAVTAALGADATLFVSSSMPIRDVEWFGDPGSAARVLANRGVNGIDGVVSTALGVAAAAALAPAGAGAGPGPVVALVGDLAFVHDSGGLLWAASRNVALTFVVVDNNGGGIFSFLAQASALEPEEFERLFATPHDLDLAALAGVHHLPVTTVSRASELTPALERATASGGVHVVLVRTDRDANVAVHDRLVAAVEVAVGGVSPG